MSHTFTRPVLKTLFVLYLLALSYVLFIYHRDIDFSWIVRGDLWLDLEDKMNLIPFKSIMSYLQKMNYVTGMSSIVENIFAHIVVFSWLGYFLPRLFEKYQNLFNFIKISFLILVSIEVLQFLSQSGMMDIDDVMINLLGAFLGFKYLRHIDDLESEENNG